jgi:hypothetical protein
MDVTFPLVELTGRERSFDELTKPDERMQRYAGLTVEQLQAPYLTIEARLPASTPAKLLERIVATRDLAVHGYFVYEFHAVSMFWAVSCVEMALKLKFAEKRPDPVTVTRKGADGSEESCRIAVAELQDYRRQKWRIPEMKEFDYSFQALLAWAFRESLLPEDIPIPVPEIVAAFENRFMLKTFPARAAKDGLLKPEPQTYGDIINCWANLNEVQKNHYLPKTSAVLVEELPRFRNMMAHPRHFNLIVFPRAPVGTYELLVDVVARLWS